MKKLFIVATLAATALGATSLMADPGHQRGQRQGAGAAGCPMAEQGQGTDRTAQREARHAEMQARMQAMHAGMGEHQGMGRGGNREHQH